MDKELQSGAILDLRTDEEKKSDFTFEELVSAPAPVVWVKKNPSDWRSFPIFDQDGSGSCVAQTLKKMLGVRVWLDTNVFVPLSASHIYQRRKNRPAPGMGHPDVFEIAKQGTTLEEFAPSEDLSDSQMDGVVVKPFMEQIGTIFRIGNYITLPAGDIEAVASVIQQTGKAVMVWFYFSSGLAPKEWVDVPVVKHPNLQKTDSKAARHSVTAVDFCLYNGKKALIIEDSWGLDKAIDGRRIITEDFFKARNVFAGYFMNFYFEEKTDTKPRHTFNADLFFGVQNEDVVGLQDILKYEGLFPLNVESTGYYGAVTQRAVEQFQVKYAIAQAGSPGYGRCGPLTRTKLNELYSN